MLYDVLDKFSVRRLDTNQSFTLHTVACMSVYILCKSFPWMNMAVSSANNLTWAPSTQFTISFILIKNSNGPKTEPWGTPYVISLDDDDVGWMVEWWMVRPLGTITGGGVFFRFWGLRSKLVCCCQMHKIAFKMKCRWWRYCRMEHLSM